MLIFEQSKSLKMSLSSVQSTLSTLKLCQGDIEACMDMVSDVALGIVEAEGEQQVFSQHYIRLQFTLHTSL